MRDDVAVALQEAVEPRVVVQRLRLLSVVLADLLDGPRTGTVSESSVGAVELAEVALLQLQGIRVHLGVREESKTLQDHL